MTPKAILDQIDIILSSNTPVKHEKLRTEARLLVYKNDVKGLHQYINGHMKVRRKMIRVEVPLSLLDVKMKPSDSSYLVS